MDKKREVLELLLTIRNEKGYLTLDQLLDCCEESGLNLLESNWVSDQIVRRNIVLLDKEPDSISVHKDNDSEDLAHVDYEEIYQKVLQLDQGLKPLVDAVKRIRPPQTGEFKELRDHIVEGNRFARNRLIEMYMRSVIKIALNTAKTFNLNISDTIQDGFIGLVKLVDTLENQTSTDFHHSVNWMIYNEIIRREDLKGANLRLPVHFKEKLRPVLKKLEDNQCFNCKKFGNCVKCEEIILKTYDNDCSVLDIFREVYYPHYSVEEIIEENSEIPGFEGDVDQLNESLSYNSENIVINKVMHDDLNLFLETKLTPKELKILTDRFGLNGNPTYTLEEIGKEFGVTRERIRQIESKALKRLRRARRYIKYMDA